MLEAEGMRVAGFTSAEDFLEAHGDATAGCLILDVRMPGMGGIALQEHLQKDAPACP